MCHFFNKKICFLQKSVLTFAVEEFKKRKNTQLRSQKHTFPFLKFK